MPRRINHGPQFKPLDPRLRFGLVSTALLTLLGCRSPYYSDRGALFGGLTGAGVGALVGDAAGNTGAGAVIGTAVGALAGAAVGDHIDADMARNRAEIAAKMGRQMQGAVTPQDVIAMTQAGLSDEVIATHIRTNGMAQPLTANDLIQLRNMGVRDNVVNAMQQTPPRVGGAGQPVAGYPGYAYPAYPAPVAAYPAPVMIAPYPPPYWGPPVGGYYYRRGPRVGWGVSVW
jgi:outer membrane protein with glycine zipper